MIPSYVTALPDGTEKVRTDSILCGQALIFPRAYALLWT